jgi:hypothetical protein
MLLSGLGSAGEAISGPKSLCETGGSRMKVGCEIVYKVVIEQRDGGRRILGLARREDVRNDNSG